MFGDLQKLGDNDLGDMGAVWFDVLDRDAGVDQTVQDRLDRLLQGNKTLQPVIGNEHGMSVSGFFRRKTGDFNEV